MSEKPDIVLALRSSIDWHAEHGRFHSAGVDADALAAIERAGRLIRTLCNRAPESPGCLWPDGCDCGTEGK